MGYHTDNDYLVRRVHIDGWGDAQNVRFERRHYGFKDIGYWTWGTQSLQWNAGVRRAQGAHGIAQQLGLKYVNNKVIRPEKRARTIRMNESITSLILERPSQKQAQTGLYVHFPLDPPAGTKDQPTIRPRILHHRSQ